MIFQINWVFDVKQELIDIIEKPGMTSHYTKEELYSKYFQVKYFPPNKFLFPFQ